ncbi:MAG: fumarate reductase/succinate dehydrogenase flavoprotein domain protein [Subtercola sp.]|nr:fumarate reductase/succinate dehydrogenase flavoprotein domain protein [Subtercola sp.]
MTFQVFGAELAREADVVFDDETDVIVVGTGAGGYAAAVTAAKNGATVIQLEKGDSIGGTTKKAAAAYWVPNNHYMREKGWADPKADALRHMARLTRPQHYDPEKPTLGLTEWEYRMIEAFYDHAGDAIETLTKWGALEGIPWDIQPDYYAQMAENKAPFGRIIYPHLQGGAPTEVGDGTDMIGVFARTADREGVDLRLQHSVERVILDDNDEVIGVIANSATGRVVIRARRAVIFATGGFTHNEELRTSSLPGPIFSGCAASTNTGDFLPIAEALGAELTNMNGAWLAPMVLDRAIANRPDQVCSFSIPGDSMVWVNKYGKRVVNEKSPYQDIVPTFWAWESQKAEYPNLILAMIWDAESKLYHSGDKYGNPMIPDGGDQSHIVSAATIPELADAIRERLASFSASTGGWNLDPSFVENLASTIERYNAFAEAGIDEDFHRGEAPIELYFNMGGRPGNDKNETMWPISATGPYYATLLAPATLDTKGGPRTNAVGRVLNRCGDPIPGLYAAGNCAGAFSGQSYWAGGATLGPIITMGYLAGQDAARQPSRVENAAPAIAS